MADLSLCLFGTFTVTLAGEPASGFDSNKVRALLAYLAVESDHAHRRESLAALLWPESPARSARTNLRNALANLRKVLRDDDPDQPFLLVTRDTLQFNRKSNAEIDVTAFNVLVNIENPTLQQLEKAVGIYQGGFLQGFSLKDSLAFDDWTLIMRERLHRRALTALQHLSSHFAQQGDYTKACEFSRKQVGLEPWREEAHRDLMRLLAVNGQRSEALMQYETSRQVLDAELGVTPSQETTALYEQIRDGQLENLGVPVIAKPAVSPSPKHNIPVQLTPFVGRKQEIAEIGARLEDPTCRLLTLVGPGGSGKTRLAVEVGQRWVDCIEHGVFLISLAQVQSTDAVVTALANALNFTFYEGMDPRQQILNYLRQKNMLLIFDNFEHLLQISNCSEKEQKANENTTTLVLDILRQAPDVKILVTSRVRLNVQGEVMFPVSGMAVPEAILEVTKDPTAKEVMDVAQYSAVELFEVSATRICPSFQLNLSNQEHVVHICHLIDGLPLGILLASAWVYMLSPAEIAAHIQESFDFLVTEMRDIPERQRSLRSVFNHSWNLLSQREREALRALSVFSGKFSRIAVQAVTGATLRELRSLADKSLLHMKADGYYEVHEIVKQYASEKLAQVQDAGVTFRDRHSAFYIAALEQWCEEIKGPHLETALYAIFNELANIRQAWIWALDHRRLNKLDQASCVLEYFFMNYRLLQEGEQWFKAAVERLEALIEGHDIDKYILTNAQDIRVFAIILEHYVYIDFWMYGRSDRTRQNLQKSHFLLDKLESAGYDIRQERADFIFFTSDATEGNKLDIMKQSLDINRELENRWGTAWALHDLGWMYWIAGNLGEAARMLQQGFELSRKLGAPRLIIAFLKSLAYVAWESGDYDLAGRLWEEELGRRQSLLKNKGMENVYQSMALITLHQGNLEKAESYANQYITMSTEMNTMFHKEVGLRRLGLVYIASGRYEQARTALSKSLEITQARVDNYEVTSSCVRLALAKLHLGQYEQASHQVQECVKLARELDAQRNISLCYLVQGRLALVNHEFEESINLLQQGIDILGGMGPRRELGPAYADLCLASMKLAQHTQAKQHLKTALEYAVKTGDFVAHVYVLPIAALYFAEYGHAEKSVTLYITAVCYPMVANSHWFGDILCNHFPEVKALTSTVFAREDQGEAISALHTTVQDLLADFI